MTQEEIKQKVKEIIAEEVGLDQVGLDETGLDGEKIKDDSTIKSLGIDSVVAPQIVVKIEDEFGVQIPDVELDSMYDTSINDLATYIAKQMG